MSIKENNIEILQQFRQHYPDQIRKINAQIDKLKDRLIRIKSPVFDAMPRGGTPYTFVDVLADIDKYEDLRSQIMAEAEIKSELVYGYIDTVLKPRHNQVLSLYYVNGMTVSEIASHIGKSVNEVYRIRREALDMIGDDPIM